MENAHTCCMYRIHGNRIFVDDDHLPQIITEALVTAKKTGRKAVSWCLTSGSRWYFGVVTLRGRDSTRNSVLDSGYTVTYFESERLELQYISDSESEGGALEAEMKKLKTIWTMLTFWSLGRPERLKDAIFSVIPKTTSGLRRSLT
ncbi:hypothetical protein DFP72DRAFT_1068310 [Ephemerocybe angulata]|uniref:Uncharacterized protein n=1 Tax=Ephemerocybe angulata TaxID=980116 RepID=A0A8H6M7A0_9AGAR|nr:hypothetical protein DFP72DRAFT_1068310 [Tulosesus angulatus]